MPPQVCAKCRGFPAQEGDSWCTGCIGWEALGRELTAHWDSEGGRHVANDLVVSTCRQVKALRSVTAGLTRSGGSVPEPRAGSSRARGDTRVPEPPAPPRKREAEGSPPKRACKEEEHSEEDEGEESEEEERREERSPPRDADHKPIREHRPRSPPGPPPPERDYPGTKSIGLHRQRENITQAQGGKENTAIVEKIAILTVQVKDAVEGSTRGCIGWQRIQSFWCTGRQAAPSGSLAQSSQGEV